VARPDFSRAAQIYLHETRSPEKEKIDMFKKVLVGVDARSGGRDAIALAIKLCEPDGDLTFARVYSGAYVPSHALSPGLVREDLAQAEDELAAMRAAAGVDAETVVKQAPTAGQGLHELAEENTADVLVVGSCHRGFFGRAMLGDDTRAALNGAPCAVAVAPAGYAQNAKPLASVGVAYDGSAESKAALEAAKALAARTHAAVRALHVVSWPTYMYTGMMPPASESVDELIKSAESDIKALPGVDGRAEYGIPSEELTKFSGEVDLLILGSRNYGPVRRMMVGSISRYLQRHAHGPVLILPRGSRYATPSENEAEAGSRAPVSA
jgi:nucleotide-binding universal stress UspA family protein